MAAPSYQDETRRFRNCDLVNFCYEVDLSIYLNFGLNLNFIIVRFFSQNRDSKRQKDILTLRLWKTKQNIGDLFTITR
jgi:hypothetical protein